MVSEYQKDVKVSQNTGNKGYDVTNPLITNNYLTDARIISKHYKITTDRLLECFDYVPKVRLMTLYKVLLIISCVPGSTVNYLAINYGVKPLSTKLALVYLVNIGYVCEVGKPRLIIPFGRYKIDKGYKITSKGETVLNKLLNY